VNKKHGYCDKNKAIPVMLVAPNTFSEFASQKYPALHVAHVVLPSTLPCLCLLHAIFEENTHIMIDLSKIRDIKKPNANV
jgi:hypothetical protein